MKDSIKELIESYERRVTALKQLHEEANDNLSKVRLAAKKSVYDDVIRELKYLVKDEEDSTGLD